MAFRRFMFRTSMLIFKKERELYNYYVRTMKWEGIHWQGTLQLLCHASGYVGIFV